MDYAAQPPIGYLPDYRVDDTWHGLHFHAVCVDTVGPSSAISCQATSLTTGQLNVHSTSKPVLGSIRGCCPETPLAEWAVSGGNVALPAAQSRITPKGASSSGEQLARQGFNDEQQIRALLPTDCSATTEAYHASGIGLQERKLVEWNSRLIFHKSTR